MFKIGDKIRLNKFVEDSESFIGLQGVIVDVILEPIDYPYMIVLENKPYPFIFDAKEFDLIENLKHICGLICSCNAKEAIKF